MKEFEQRVIDVLVHFNIIPSTGLFQIEESHLVEYVKVYGEIFSSKERGLKRTNEIRFARKLAGRTLVRLLKERGYNFSHVKAGMIYMISNPVFPSHKKIGMTMDVVDRLSSYQTYDPLRRYKIDKYNFVLDRKRKEREILLHPDALREEGEWIASENAERIFSLIAT